MTRSSLLCVRSTSLGGKAIQAWDGDHVSHVGVRVGNTIVDATFWHGVKAWPAYDWLHRYVLVDDTPIHPLSAAHQQTAEMRLFDRIGQRYDVWEIAGFVLLRDLGHPARPICSRLAIDYITDACAVRLPGKQGRVGPRLVRATLHAYNAGRSAALNPPMGQQPAI
jgi:hypothetical protein